MNKPAGVCSECGRRGELAEARIVEKDGWKEWEGRCLDCLLGTQKVDGAP